MLYVLFDIETRSTKNYEQQQILPKRKYIILSFRYSHNWSLKKQPVAQQIY